MSFNHGYRHPSLCKSCQSKITANIQTLQHQKPKEDEQTNVIIYLSVCGLKKDTFCVVLLKQSFSLLHLFACLCMATCMSQMVAIVILGLLDISIRSMC